MNYLLPKLWVVTQCINELKKYYKEIFSQTKASFKPVSRIFNVQKFAIQIAYSKPVTNTAGCFD